MLLVYGHHKVKDYDQWRPLFDSDEARRNQYGIKTLRVMNRLDDPNDIHLSFAIESVEKFNECISSTDIGDIMEKAGVLEKPTFIFLKDQGA